MISSEYFRKLLTSLKALQTRLDLLFRRNASNTCAAYSLIQRQPWSAHCLLTLAISMVDLFTFFSIKFSWAYVSNKKRHHTCVPIRVHFIIIQMYLFGLLAMYVDIFYIRLFHHLSLLVPNVFSLFVFKRSFYFFFECADFFFFTTKILKSRRLGFPRKVHNVWWSFYARWILMPNTWTHRFDSRPLHCRLCGSLSLSRFNITCWPIWTGLPGRTHPWPLTPLTKFAESNFVGAAAAAASTSASFSCCMSCGLPLVLVLGGIVCDDDATVHVVLGVEVQKKRPKMCKKCLLV